MSIDTSYEVFLNYLETQGIKKRDIPIKETGKKYRKLGEQDVIDQLQIISEFSKKAMGYRGYKSKTLDNKTGKIVEEYKVNIKKVKREIRNIKLNSPSNSFEELILENSQQCLERAENCIKEIYDFGFTELLSRSMKRSEICLGNTDFSNLKKEKKIEVLSLRHCAYNMVEMDGFYLLSKLKRKRAKLDFFMLCNRFCGFEKLDKNSEKYILALLSYPYEFMKCYEMYREDKSNCDVELYKRDLVKAMKKDGKSLI